MRLTEDEQRTIRDVVARHMTQLQGDLLLYGSRTNDARRGGDIDLALRVPSSAVSILQKKKIALLIALKERLGEQRIDLSIVSEDAARTDPFFRLALKDAVTLAEFR